MGKVLNGPTADGPLPGRGVNLLGALKEAYMDTLRTLFPAFLLMTTIAFIVFKIDLRKAEIDDDTLIYGRLAEIAAMTGSVGALLAIITTKPSPRRSDRLTLVLSALTLHVALVVIIIAVKLWPA
jgi:uncharacterized membrane protein YsdA (DUF1294 family)